MKAKIIKKNKAIRKVLAKKRNAIVKKLDYRKIKPQFLKELLKDQETLAKSKISYLETLSEVSSCNEETYLA